jgi:serine/threonine-protein kinase
VPTFSVPLDDAKAQFPEYQFVRALTPSAQKAAFHVRDGNSIDLCLKIVSPDYERDRLDREIQAMQLVDHPNVVKLREYTFSSRPGTLRHFIVEEFIAGKDLAEHFPLGTQIDALSATLFFARVCDGLVALKNKSIVHRDLKPQNIRVRPDGTPVIIDFGLARHLNLPALTHTLQGAGIGTPAYFAPEQFTGTKHDIDHRTDLFALGIMLYEAVTGESPFLTTGITRAQLQDAVCTRTEHLQRPRFLSLDNPLRLLLTKLLQKDRLNRPSDAQQVATILRKVGGHS